MRTDSSDRSGWLGAVVFASVGAVLGAALGVGIGIGGALLSRALGSDDSGWRDIGIAAFAVVFLAPLLTIGGTLVALRLRTGRAVPRPIMLTVPIVVVAGAVGALLGSGVFRWSLAGVGVAAGIAIAAGFDAGMDRS